MSAKPILSRGRLATCVAILADTPPEDRLRLVDFLITQLSDRPGDQ
jgi:hypothetical protein